MRVLHVITGLDAGGAEQQLALLLRHTRHTSEVVSLTGIGSVGRRLVEDGVPVHALHMRGNRDPRAVRRLVRIIRGGAFDVVHVHLYRACVYGRLAARIAGVRTVVTTEHSLGDTHLEGRAITPPIRALYLATARWSEATIAVSPTVERRLVDWGLPRERVVGIPNGLDVPAMRFDPQARQHARRELGIGPDELVIGSVGRLHPVKRFDALVAGAAPQLRDGARLLLVGTGPDEPRLRERSRALGVADRLVLPGERSDVSRMLSAMDVYAAPSREETFGLAVLEALASGLPAVVGACPALDGLQLPQVRRISGPDELPDALAAAARDAPTDHSRTPPTLLAERFGIGSVARRVDALYERLETGAPPRAAAREHRRPAAHAYGTAGGVVTRVEVTTDLRSVAPEWEALADRVDASPFVRPGWIEAWNGAFGGGPLRVVCARRGRALVGVLPVQSSGGRVTSPTNYETPMFGLLAVDLSAACLLVEDLVARGARSIDLGYVPAGSLTEHAVERVAATHGQHLVRHPQLDSPYIDLTVGWDTYEKRFSSKRRKDFRRSRRRLEKYGELTFDVIRDAERLPEVFEECLRVEASGWKGEVGTAMASSPEMERFYTDVAHHAASQGTLVLTTMRVDGDLAAFDLGVEQGDTLYSLKVAYEETYRKGSPGIVITHEVVRQAFDSGCSRYDWLGSDEPWKAVWTDDRAERARLLLLAPTLTGRLTRFVIANGDRLPDPVVAQGKAVIRRVLRR